jgi:hypothetical protein
LRSPQARSLVPAISISIDPASLISPSNLPSFSRQPQISPPLPTSNSPFLTVSHPSAPTPPLGNSPTPSPTAPQPLGTFLRHHSPAPASPLSQGDPVQVDQDQPMQENWEDVQMQTSSQSQPSADMDMGHGRPKPKHKFSLGPRPDCEKCRLRVPGHWAHFD